MFKKFFLIIIILLLLIIPVNAITENMDYISDLQSGEVEITLAGSNWCNIYNLFLQFPAIEEWGMVKAIVIHFNTQATYTWNVRDINIHTDVVPVTYQIDGNIIGTGDMQFIRTLDASNNLKDGILTFTFDDIFDLGGYSGNQKVLLNFNHNDFNLDISGSREYGDTYIKHTNNCPVLLGYDSSRSLYHEGVGYLEIIAYKYGAFHHQLIYDYSDDTVNSIDFYLNRMNYASNILMTGYSGMVIIDETVNTNYNINNLYDIPYLLSIKNPVYSGSGLYEYFNYTIPEGLEPSTPETIILQWSAYNASIGGDRIEVDYILNAKENNDWIEQSSGTNPYYIDSVLPSNSDCQIIISQTGYETNTIDFTTPGYDILKNFPIYPDYGDNYTIIFQIENQDGYLLEDVKVDLNNEIKYTPWNGKVEFKNISSPIIYKITKIGYSSIYKTLEITKSQQIVIQLNSLPADDLVILSWYAYNAESSNEIIGVNYVLSIKNQITDNWETQTTGYNPSYLDISIPKNSQYRMNLSSPDYNPYSEIFDIIYSQTAMNFPMFHDYGDNFSVIFRIEDTDGKRLSSVKIECNNQIKYTPYNGIIGFSDVPSSFTYEISKTNYIPLSGSRTITNNLELYIIMYTEEELLPTETIIPTITPDLDQPSNIMESVKYSFQKILGLEVTEDGETINLIMGLLIILGCTCLIAHVTHNALGAVVGGLIGFVMALALGFIPLWILFVAFASFAIYIILTKSGGE